MSEEGWISMSQALSVVFGSRLCRSSEFVGPQYCLLSNCSCVLMGCGVAGRWHLPFNHTKIKDAADLQDELNPDCSRLLAAVTPQSQPGPRRAGAGRGAGAALGTAGAAVQLRQTRLPTARRLLSRSNAFRLRTCFPGTLFVFRVFFQTTHRFLTAH